MCFIPLKFAISRTNILDAASFGFAMKKLPIILIMLALPIIPKIMLA